MTFEEYQERAREIAIYPADQCVNYPIVGLAGKVGEVCNVWQKVLRDQDGYLTGAQKSILFAELGGALCMLAAACSDLGFSLDAVAANNLATLASRKARGTLSGSGDDR